MKNLTLLFCLCMSLLCFSQEEPQAIQITENTVIKDPDGNRVDIKFLTENLATKKYNIEPKTDAEGNMYLQLVKLSNDDRNTLMALEKQNEETAFYGNTLPNFDLTDRSGNKITTENTEGKVVVFNFWFASCPPCIQEVPELNEVYQKYKDNENVVFAAITFELEERIVPFLAKYPLQYPIVGQASNFSQSVSRGAYPTNVIVNRKGEIQEYISGGMIGIGKLIEAAIETAL